jgi:Ca2+ transporting ATPase
MSSVIRVDGTIRLLCKGAAEMVLQKCEYALNPDGTVSPLTSATIKHYSDKIPETAAKGLRCICLAYRDFIEVWDENNDGVGYEEKFVCVGIVGIEDPLRPEVPHSVALCRRAGITVRMVTGDNILTACKIARDCGILTSGDAMEGPDFSNKTDEEIDEILPRLQVLARSTPADKFRLVNCLRANGEVVAVTGDGTNDAPALSAADVGLAMGITGTQVAKQAADIIILDDNFASIVKSVMWGRCVYDNIRKFLQFQLTVNVVALIVAFIGAVTDYGTPLTAIQLLWVNLIMDTMAALALGTEKPTLRLLNRKPYGKSGKLITWIMLRNIIGHGLFQTAILFAILFAINENDASLLFPGVYSGRTEMAADQPSVHYTMVFNTFVFLQVFNEINSRKVNLQRNVFDGIFTNPIFCGIIVITIIVQVFIIEFGKYAVKTVPLTFDQWLYCVLIGYMTLPFGFLLRLIPVPLEEWGKETEYE